MFIQTAIVLQWSASHFWILSGRQKRPKALPCVVVALCCCQDAFQLCFHLFSWDSPSGWVHSSSRVGDGRGKCVKWKLLALPLPYLTIYLNSECTHDGWSKAPLQAYYDVWIKEPVIIPSFGCPWDNAL